MINPKNGLYWITISLCFLVDLQVLAQGATAIPTDGLEIKGLIVDETHSKIGRDFYELFFERWEGLPGETDYTVIVREKMLPGLGSRVVIAVNDLEVFEQTLQPRYEAVEAVAQYAVELLQNYLENYEMLLLQLENEDQAGTGIY